MDKRAKTIIETSIIILLVIVVLSVFVLAQVRDTIVLNNIEGSSPGISLNTKEYDEKTETISIKDGAKNVADITLNTPKINRVIRGKDRRVAEFTINNFDDYNGVFNGLEFYDVKSSMQKFDRDFTYKQKVVVGQREIKEYEMVCTEGSLLGNGTVEANCVNEEVGNHFIDVVEWVPINADSELKSGEITIGIFTDVKANERVEWVPTLFNVRIDEWAEWTEGLSDGLVSYWNFDAGSGTVLPDVANATFNFSSFSGDPAWNGTNVLLNNSLEFDGNDHTGSTTITPSNDMNEFTWSIWFNLDSDSANSDRLVMETTPLGANSREIFISGGVGTQITFRVGDGASDKEAILTGASLGSWHHVVGTAKANDKIRIYHNGDNTANTSIAGFGSTTENLFLASNGAGIDLMNGRLDEFGYWDRALTDSEIEQLYNSGTGITFDPAPGDFPTNVSIYIGNDAQIFSHSGELSTTERTNNFIQELDDELTDCSPDEEGYCTVPIIVHSDSPGQIKVDNIDIYFNITEYIWDRTGLASLSTYKVRVKATDGNLNSSWDESDNDFTIGDLISDDTYKFNIRNSLGEIIAWLGDEGNIVLEGTCSASANCVAPADSWIVSNSTDSTVAYIDNLGNLCVEKGDCTDQSVSCSPTRDAFRVLNASTGNVVSYIDFDGDLCLTGSLIENADI